MKKNLILFIIILINGIITAQNKTYKYFDVNEKEISNTEYVNFIKSNRGAYFPIQFEDETHFYNYLQKREVEGKLTSEELNELKNNLQINNYSNNIIIVYYPGSDPCNSGGTGEWNVLEKKTNKDLEKVAPFDIFYIYKSQNGLRKGKIQWQEDKDQTVEKTFFPVHYMCYSLAIVSKEGNFIKILGEYSNREMIEAYKKLSISF